MKEMRPERPLVVLKKKKPTNGNDLSVKKHEKKWCASLGKIKKAAQIVLM